MISRIVETFQNLKTLIILTANWARTPFVITPNFTPLYYNPQWKTWIEDHPQDKQTQTEIRYHLRNRDVYFDPTM